MELQMQRLPQSADQGRNSSPGGPLLSLGGRAGIDASMGSDMSKVYCELSQGRQLHIDEMAQILSNPDVNRISHAVPVKPKAGCVYVYPIQFEKDFAADHYLWCNNGSKLYPKQEPLVTKTFYNIRVEGKKGSLAFQRIRVKSVDEQCPVFLVMYLGDDEVARHQFLPHGNSKIKTRPYIRQPPSVKAKIIEAYQAAKMRSLAYTDNPDETQPRPQEIYHALITQPGLPEMPNQTKIRNVIQEIRKSERKRVSKVPQSADDGTQQEETSSEPRSRPESSVSQDFPQQTSPKRLRTESEMLESQEKLLHYSSEHEGQNSEIGQAPWPAVNRAGSGAASAVPKKKPRPGEDEIFGNLVSETLRTLPRDVKNALRIQILRLIGDAQVQTLGNASTEARANSPGKHQPAHSPHPSQTVNQGISRNPPSNNVQSEVQSIAKIENATAEVPASAGAAFPGYATPAHPENSSDGHFETTTYYSVENDDSEGTCPGIQVEEILENSPAKAEYDGLQFV